MSVERKLERKLLWSGDEGYEEARRAAVWNGRKPARLPAGIVLAEDVDDVVAAVRLAKGRQLQVSVRAGGHSYSAVSLREGTLLIDVSRLRGLDVDARARTAVAGPGVLGEELDRVLDPLRLLFPHGHCATVALGGFLLGGGIGWGWRGFGPGCSQVRAVDVVTADGEVVRADASHNKDLYWAARGAGPGFFGVAVAFHVRLLPMPAVIKGVFSNYPLEVRGELFDWLYESRHEMAPIVDQAAYTTQYATQSPEGATTLLGAAVFANSEREADDALAPFVNTPLAEKAIWSNASPPLSGMQELQSTLSPDSLFPPGFRYTCDSIVSSASASTLMPAYEAALTSTPTPRSHVSWVNLAGSPALSDMAFSVLGDTLIQLAAVSDEPNRDAEMQAWATDHARQLNVFASGSLINEEAMVARGVGPDAFFPPDKLSRLETLRNRWDPDGRFVSFPQG
ncbi:FAD-binding oxidoreductase [Streptomyces blattellae]|uniref:FAD-binding oxidoreductase n=1 Tax=Streptomyces blattellae TaxID=2569855 RepID=UPI0012B90DFC|nr:FAD-binding oxidoreductase [Streptomyces blattellae]